MDASYEPQLIVPSQVLTLDPAWASCILDLEGLPDPPYALTAVDAPVMRTEIGDGMPTPEPAKPGPTKKPGLAPVTLTGSGVAPVKATGKPELGNGDPRGHEHDHAHDPGSDGGDSNDSGPGRQDQGEGEIPSNQTPGRPKPPEVPPSPVDPKHSPKPGFTAPLPTIGPFPIILKPDGGVQIGPSTLHPGGPAQTIGSHTVSLANDGAIWVGSHGQTSLAGHVPHYHLQGRPAGWGSSESGTGTDRDDSYVQVGGLTVFRNSDGELYVGSGQIIPLEQKSITISGHTVYMNAAGTAIKVDGKWYRVQDLHFSDPSPSSASQGLLPLGSQIFTAGPHGEYIIDDGRQTLSRGGTAVLVSGTKISLASDGRVVVIGSSTTMTLPTPSDPHGHGFQTLTVHGEVLTANANGAFVIDGHTIIPGGAAVSVSGTRISLAPDDAFVVVGSKTEVLKPGVTSLLSSMILDGFGKARASVMKTSTMTMGGDGVSSAGYGRGDTSAESVSSSSKSSAAILVLPSKAVFFSITMVMVALLQHLGMRW